MSDWRQPTAQLLVSRASRRTTLKVELFPATNFPVERFTAVNGRSIRANVVGSYLRIRVNGRWFPSKRRVLYSQNEVMKLLKRELFT